MVNFEQDGDDDDSVDFETVCAVVFAFGELPPLATPRRGYDGSPSVLALAARRRFVRPPVAATSVLQLAPLCAPRCSGLLRPLGSLDLVIQLAPLLVHRLCGLLLRPVSLDRRFSISVSLHRVHISGLRACVWLVAFFYVLLLCFTHGRPPVACILLSVAF